MATFVGGLVIGLINCWQIALLTLGTGPFIVAAGGLSNIFLQRLAENIQEAYAEAATVADQVIITLNAIILTCFSWEVRAALLLCHSCSHSRVIYFALWSMD